MSLRRVLSLVFVSVFIVNSSFAESCARLHQTSKVEIPASGNYTLKIYDGGDVLKKNVMSIACTSGNMVEFIFSEEGLNNGSYVYKVENTLSEVIASGAFDVATLANNGDTIRMVDLGLPSGTLWADRNVGSNSPAGTGDFFSWGELETKSEYSWSTYMNGEMADKPDCGTAKDPVYVAHGSERDISGTEFDAVEVKWGDGFEMPDSTQIAELLNSTYTTWTWTSQKNKAGTSIYGYRVTSKVAGYTSNSIFIPAVGVINGTTHEGENSLGNYWTSTRTYSDAGTAYSLSITSSSKTLNTKLRSGGRTIRPVKVP